MSQLLSVLESLGFFFILGFTVYEAIILAFRHIASHSAFVVHRGKEDK